MDPHVSPGPRRGIPRHAHRRSRQPARAALLAVLVGAGALASLSLGAVAGAGSSGGPPQARAAAASPAAFARGADDRSMPAGSRVAASPRPDPGALPEACVPGPTPSPSPAPTPARSPLVVFLGDSYTSGYRNVGMGAHGWPALVSAAFDWRMVNLAVPGTGFVNPGWTNQPMRTQLATVIDLAPEVVVIAGGHNDRRYGAAAASKAADDVIGRLRSTLPGTVLVIVGPIWQDGSPARSIVGLRDHLRAEAKAVDALFIDPIAGRWFAGAAHRYIGSDGIHPTTAGHRHLAELVGAALRADPRLDPKAPGRSADPSGIAREPIGLPAAGEPCPD